MLCSKVQSHKNDNIEKFIICKNEEFIEYTDEIGRWQFLHIGARCWEGIKFQSYSCLSRHIVE